MIDTLIKNETAYFGGFFYTTREDCEKNLNGVYFEYEEMQGDMFSASHIVRNLLSVDGRRAIRTTWNLPFAPRKYLLLDGQKYIIEQTESFENEGPSQVNYLFRNPITEQYLRIVHIDNPSGVIRQ